MVEGIDLTVRMLNRRPDLRAAVLENEHIFDVVLVRQVRGSLGPQIDDIFDFARLERGER